MSGSIYSIDPESENAWRSETRMGSPRSSFRKCLSQFTFVHVFIQQLFASVRACGCLALIRTKIGTLSVSILTKNVIMILTLMMALNYLLRLP